MRALLHAYLVGLEAFNRSILSEPPSTCTALLYVRSDTTMDPMCVRAAKALVRLCICPGSSELSMFAQQTRLTYELACVSKSFCDFVPEVEAISCLKKPILARDQSIFYTNFSEKNTEDL